MAFPQLIGAGNLNAIPPEEEWLFEGNFNSDDWLEAVSLYSPRQIGLGHKRSHATLTGYLPYDKLKSALVYFLGFSWVDENRFLRRQVPGNHPDLPNLFATEILSASFVKFITKAVKPHKWSVPVATYQLVKLTVAYSQPPYEILADGSLLMADQNEYKGQELRRWMNWNPKPTYENLVLPGGAMVYKDARGVPPAGVDGMPAGFGQRALFRQQKSTRKVIWHDVPIDFVFDQYGFMTKFENAIGKINSDTDFFGQPAHTWLLDDVDIAGKELYADPLATIALEGFTRRMDIVMTFRYFNPAASADGTAERGWRLQPNTQKMEYVPTMMTGDHAKQFPEEADFADLFRAWDV